MKYEGRITWLCIHYFYLSVVFIVFQPQEVALLEMEHMLFKSQKRMNDDL